MIKCQDKIADLIFNLSPFQFAGRHNEEDPGVYWSFES